jgi:hypothetical protein
MDRAWRMHGWEDTYIPSFDKKPLAKRCCLEDVVVFGKTVRKWILKK